MKSIGIVICNYNKKEYLKDCLNSLLMGDLPRESYDIIVVDNASEDGAVEMIQNEFSNEVILLQNEINSGGSGGFAKGIAYVQEKKYDYTVLLDNDIKLEKDTIVELKKHIDNNPEVGIVGSKICTMDNPDILQELGSFIDFEKFNATTPLKGHKDSNELPAMVECDYVPACCLITTKDVIKKAGNFDVDHFIYWDDMDWCTRIKKCGYRIHAINSSRVFHKMGAVNTINTFSLYYFERNRILYFLKNLQEEQLPAFINKISEELINLTFFSNEKRKYNSAISTLLGIDDLDRGTIGRQDKHILNKEQIDPFTLFNDQKNYQIILVSIDNMSLLRRIYLALDKYFDCSITIASELKNFESLSYEFNDTKIIDKKIIKQNSSELVFYAIEHIMQSDIENNLSSNSLYIDVYLNIKYASQVKEYIASYKNYEQIFLNIFTPILEEKFNSIRLNL
ncbi:MAG: glycosyltransferase [Helicobacteraceae bacterium]|nr:glycosyltransferase [Helicobacteraceae bacterium]